MPLSTPVRTVRAWASSALPSATASARSAFCVAHTVRMRSKTSLPRPAVVASMVRGSPGVMPATSGSA
ncbi:hypothetical protein SALBM135S_05086 [Streptomyces alboniger]